MPLTWTIRRVAEDAFAVELAGFLDADAVPRLEELFSELRANGSRRVVLELGEVRRLTRPALAALFQGHVRLLVERGGIALAKMPERMATAVEQNGGFIPTGRDADEALARLTELLARPRSQSTAAPVYGAPPWMRPEAPVAAVYGGPPMSRLRARGDGSLVPCGACGRHVAAGAESCPFCGSF